MDPPEALAVGRALTSAGIRCAISGGWGVDALLRRQTREHRDLDLAVDAAAVDRAVRALGSRGYFLALDQRPARLELGTSDDRLVDIHPVRWQADGTGQQRGFGDHNFDYPAGSTEWIGVIDGEEVLCVSPSLQFAFHAGYDPQGHDRRDIALLAAKFGLDLPSGYGPAPTDDPPFPAAARADAARQWSAVTQAIDASTGEPELRPAENRAGELAH